MKRALQRITQGAGLGLRWIRCGARLYARNPWLLGGMGVCAAALVAAAGAIPFLGGPLLGLLAPALAASFYVAIDGVAQQRLRLPAKLRTAALKQAPKELLNIARDERRLLQVVLLGLYALVGVVLTDVLVWSVAGTAWSNRALGVSGQLVPVLLGVVVLLAAYLLLAASLVYTLPLTLLRGEPLIPSIAASFARSMRHPVALLAVAALGIAPFLLEALLAIGAPVLAYAAAFAAGAALMPLVACSLYCSYRTLFPPTEPAHDARTPAKPVPRAG